MRERILAVDYGTKRVGLAVSDPLGITHPLGFIKFVSSGRLVEDLKKIIEEKSVRCVVLGLPLNMDGTEGPMSVASRNLARKIEEECGVSVHLTDERLTSWEAENILIDDLDLSREKRKGVKDSMAACLILKSYLAANP